MTSPDWKILQAANLQEQLSQVQCRKLQCTRVLLFFETFFDPFRVLLLILYSLSWRNVRQGLLKGFQLDILTRPRVACTENVFATTSTHDGNYNELATETRNRVTFLLLRRCSQYKVQTIGDRVVRVLSTLASFPIPSHLHAHRIIVKQKIEWSLCR